MYLRGDLVAPVYFLSIRKLLWSFETRASYRFASFEAFGKTFLERAVGYRLNRKRKKELLFASAYLTASVETRALLHDDDAEWK